MDTSHTLTLGQWQTLAAALRLRAKLDRAHMHNPRISKRERGRLAEHVLELREQADAIDRGEIRLGPLTSTVEVTTHLTLVDTSGRLVGRFDIAGDAEDRDFGSTADLPDLPEEEDERLPALDAVFFVQSRDL